MLISFSRRFGFFCTSVSLLSPPATTFQSSSSSIPASKVTQQIYQWTNETSLNIQVSAIHKWSMKWIDEEWYTWWYMPINLFPLAILQNSLWTHFQQNSHFIRNAFRSVEGFLISSACTGTFTSRWTDRLNREIDIWCRLYSRRHRLVFSLILTWCRILGWLKSQGPLRNNGSGIANH